MAKTTNFFDSLTGKITGVIAIGTIVGTIVTATIFGDNFYNDIESGKLNDVKLKIENRELRDTINVRHQRQLQENANIHNILNSLYNYKQPYSKYGNVPPSVRINPH